MKNIYRHYKTVLFRNLTCDNTGNIGMGF